MAVACSEVYAPGTTPPAARRWFHARRGELRGPQTAVYLSAPTSTQPPEQKCHSERSWPLSHSQPQSLGSALLSGEGSIL